MKRVVALVLAAALALPAFAALKPGAKAPMFTAPAFLAGKAFTFDLAAALKKGPVVVYFFPAAFTPGCNVEAAAFSQDTEKCAGKFPVAADAGAKIAKSFDATMTLKPDLASRTSYVIAQDGSIAFVHDAMSPNLHVKQTLAAVTALKAKAQHH